MDVPNASVTARAADGTVLAETITNATGNFMLEGRLPASYRVESRLAGGSLAFAAEVRAPSFVVVNVPNTLVSRYLQAHPQASLEQAESLVRARLSLPAEGGLDFIEDGPRVDFSHLAFFSAASANGGCESFLARLAAEGQPVPRFRLTRETLGGQDEGLEAELRPLLALARSQPRLLETLSTSSVLAAGGFLLSGVGDSILSTLTENTLAWITTSLGWNVGTAGALETIQDQLDELADELDTLELEGAANGANTALTSVVSSTSVLVSDQSAAVQVAVSDGITNRPTTSVNGSLTTLLASLGSYQAATNLGQIQTFMLGLNDNTNLITTNLKLLLNQSYGIQQSGQPFPVRSSFLLDQALDTFNFYQGYQALAANYLVEQAHPVVPIQPPAINLLQARTSTDQAAYQVALQRMQLPPYPASDLIFVDLQYGLMWCTSVQAPMSYNDAINFVDKFSYSAGSLTFEDWRLPTTLEIQALQNRGRFVANSLRDSSVAHDGSDSSYGNYGYCLQGLSGLGFVGVNQYGSDGYTWIYNWYYITSWLQDDSLTAWGMNHQDGKALKTDNNKLPFVMVRSLGRELLPILDYTDAPSVPTYPPGMDVPPQRLEFVGEGVPTGFAGANYLTGQTVGINHRQLTGGANDTFERFDDAIFIQPIVEYTMFLGGTFTLGNSGQLTEKLPSNSYTQSIPLGGSQGAFSATTTPVAFQVGQGDFSVSNYPDYQGLILAHSTPQVFQTVCTVLGLEDASKPISATFSSSSLTAPTPYLKHMLISPRNLVVTGLGSTVTVSQNYYCTGYYSDGTVEDLTPKVTWTVVNKATGQPNQSTSGGKSVGVFFSGSTLTIADQDNPASRAQALYTVRASLSNAPLQNGKGTIEDVTDVQIGLPPN